MDEEKKALPEEKALSQMALELGHLIKYNMYLNAKATVFAAVLRKIPYNEEVYTQAISITGQIMKAFGEQDHGKRSGGQDE